MCQRRLAVLYQATGRLGCAEECIRWYIAHLTNRYKGLELEHREQERTGDSAMVAEHARKWGAAQEELALAQTLLSAIVSSSHAESDADCDEWSEEMRDLDNQAMRVMYQARAAIDAQRELSGAMTCDDI